MENLNEHPQIAELLEALEQNGLTKEKTEVQSLVTYIGSMEETLTGMLGELKDMRKEINLLRLWKSRPIVILWDLMECRATSDGSAVLLGV